MVRLRLDGAVWRTLADFPPSQSNEKPMAGWSPSINGRRWNKLEAVAECLFDNLGREVPYKRLLGVIGRNSDNPTSRHLLRGGEPKRPPSGLLPYCHASQFSSEQ
jgi:hypothetical protein